MELGYENCYALILYKGKVEAVRVHKERGFGYSFHNGKGIPVVFDDYDKHLDLYSFTEDDHVEAVHVIATAPQSHFLPAVDTIPLQDKAMVDLEVENVLQAIDNGRDFSERGHYIKLLLTEENRYSLLYPFIAQASGVSEGVSMAVSALKQREIEMNSPSANRISYITSIKL